MDFDLPSTFDLNATLGALSIGSLVSIFLFGIGTLQTYIYFITFPDDRRTFKTLVLFIWLAELAHCICVCHFVYLWTISQYGNYLALTGDPPSTLPTTLLIGAFIGPVVQVFFADRLRMVSEGRLLIPIVCWTAAAVMFSLEIFLYSKTFTASPTLSLFETKCRWIIITVLGLSATVDLIEAFSLFYYLNKLRSLTVGSTTTNIHSIMKLTLETGLLKSIAELSVLTCFLLMPHNFIWLALFICLARWHSNSLLASLNSRTILRQNNSYDVERHPVSSVQFTVSLTKPVTNEVQYTSATTLVGDASTS